MSGLTTTGQRNLPGAQDGADRSPSPPVPQPYRLRTGMRCAGQKRFCRHLVHPRRAGVNPRSGIGNSGTVSKNPCIAPSSPPGPWSARKADRDFALFPKSCANVAPTSIVTASYPRRQSDRWTAAPVRSNTSRSDDRPPMSTPMRERGQTTAVSFFRGSLISARSLPRSSLSRSNCCSRLGV